MRYISVECEYFSAKFVPNPALLPELFLSEAMSFHSGGVDEQGKGQAPCNGHNEIGCKPSRNRGHNIFTSIRANLSRDEAKSSSISWGPDRRTLASGGSDPTICLWDAESRSARAARQGHSAAVNGPTFTPDNRSLLNGSHDGTLRLWDVGSGELLRILQGYAASLFDVDWSPDGTQLASAGSDNVVTLWEMERSTPPKVLRGHCGVVYAVAWSPDGCRLASCGDDGAITIWELERGEHVRTLRRDRLYERLTIIGIRGLTQAEIMSRPSEVYVRPLLPEEQEWIHRLYQQTTHVGFSSRYHIILLSAQHDSVPQIAALLFSSEDTVARCIHAFNRSGLEGILPQQRVERPAKITEEYLKKLLELVESDPRDLHDPFSTWTTELLAMALKEHTGLEVDASSVRRTLHRQGYSVQRPMLSVSSPDPEYEQKCARLHELQQRALAGEIDLYYEDEVDLALLPGVMRCWSKQGHQWTIETPRQNQKQYGAGLIHWISGKLYWATGEH